MSRYESTLRWVLTLALALAASLGASVARAAGPAPADDADCPALLQHTFNRLQTGEAQSLCQFQGKVLLVVNTASYCGNTPQYEGLEAMYRKYKDRGLVVIGFPVERLRQPGARHEQGDRRVLPHDLWRAVPDVREIVGGRSAARIRCSSSSSPRRAARRSWNFHKYVVDRSGTRW